MSFACSESRTFTSISVRGEGGTDKGGGRKRKSFLTPTSLFRVFVFCNKQNLFPERPKINTLYHLFRRAGLVPEDWRRAWAKSHDVRTTISAKLSSGVCAHAPHNPRTLARHAPQSRDLQENGLGTATGRPQLRSIHSHSRRSLTLAHCAHTHSHTRLPSSLSRSGLGP